MVNPVLLYGHDQSANTYHALSINGSEQLEVEVKNTSLAVTSSDLTTIAGAVSGSEMQVDIVSKPALASGTDSVDAVQSGAWNVTANAGTNLNTSALALETGGNLATIAGDTTSLDGKVTACDTGAVVVSSSALPAGASTSALQTSGNASLTSLDTKITACDTGSVVVSSSALPAGASTSALQTTGNSTLTSMSGYLAGFGTSGTFWSSASPLNGTNSASVDIQFCKSVTIMGNETIASPTLTIWASADNSNWYMTTDSIFVTGGSDFYHILSNNFNARYIRLQTNADCTDMTAVCVAKM